MHDETSIGEAIPTVETVEPYDAPRVESVVTADDLARDIQYAGIDSDV